MQTMNSNNLVTLSGYAQGAPCYSHTLYKEAYYTLYLRVPRLSGTEDLLPVTVGEHLFASLPRPGEGVWVRGQLRSYNRHGPSGNRLVVTVFARELQLLEPRDGCENLVHLRGFVCKKPVYRTTPFRREITDLLLAVNRSFHRSDYLPLIAWGKNARLCESLRVGDAIETVGRFQSREYQKLQPDGSAVFRTAYEVSASSIDRWLLPPFPPQNG